MIEMAHKFFIGVASLGLFLQAVPADVGSALQIAEHLTLSGALLIGVIVLWRSNQKKDELLIKTTETVTAALASSAASNTELRKQVAGLEHSLENRAMGMKA